MIRGCVPLRRTVPLQRGLPPKRTAVRKMRIRPRRGRERCPDYLVWIRTLPCVVCLRVSGGLTVIEAAHTNALGPRGIGQKTSDFSAIPLCATHHRENPDSYHHLGERWFAQAHQIHLPELVQALNSRYALQCPSPIDSLFLMEASTVGNADWQPEAQLGAALPDGAGHLATTGHGRLQTGK